MSDTLERRLLRNHKKLYTHPATMVYAGVIQLGNVEVVDNPSMTACTNGLDCLYGREFCDEIPDAELRGIIIHENLHKSYMHMTIFQDLAKKNMSVTNKACDYYINSIIKKMEEDTNGFITLPAGALYDPRFEGMSSREIFKILENEQDEEDEQTSGQDNSCTSQGFEDTHDWTDAKEMSEQQVEELKEQIKQAVFEGQKLAGKKNGDVPRGLTDLLVPKLDYRTIMQEFATSTVKGGDDATYARPSRRHHNGSDLIMPSYEDPSIGRGVIAFDMSASITNQEVLRLVSEAIGCFTQCKPEAVDILYWDTKVARHETYTQDELDDIPNQTKPKGGGGTDVQCVADYINEYRLKPDFIMVFTDNYLGGDYGSGWSTDKILWVITETGSNEVPTIGTYARIN